MNEDNLSWHEQDSFWDIVEPVLFSKKRIQNAPNEIGKIITMLGSPKGSRVLDLCCGIGRHSIELARQGYEVTGVDSTRKYLAKASLKANIEGLYVEYLRDDMRKFRRPNYFEAILSMFTSFGYFEDQEDDIKVLKNIYSSLKPGGAFLIDVMGKEVLSRIYLDNNWYEEEGMLVLEERRVLNNWSWMENRWIIIKDGVRTDLDLSHRIYSAAELQKLMADCGFSEVKAFGNLEGAPYDQYAERLVMLAKK